MKRPLIPALIPLLFATWGLPVFADSLAKRNDSRAVFQDDFEAATSGRLPTGWSPWGNQDHNTPADFISDDKDSHSGTNCFRIHHSANSTGYIVLSPKSAIHPQAGRIYTASFWARADRPGKSAFEWSAYQKIHPFTGSTQPGGGTFEVGKQWTEFNFTIREGLDLLADQSPYLMLVFRASPQAKEERTLWIDDVCVVEQPDPNPVTLIHATDIRHETINHRLQLGNRLEFSVDPAQRLKRATSEVGGVSFHRLCGWTGQPYNRSGEYTLSPELETAIHEMRLPMTRIYAVGDEPFGVEAGLDKVVEMCRRVGVTQDHCVVEFEEQGAHTKLTPEAWARGVRYSVRQGYHFHHWEIGNEPYSSLWGNGQAFTNADDFIQHFKAVARAVRAVDTKAQLGLDIHPENVKWGNYLLKKLAGDYDFIAPHYYSTANVRKLPFEEIVLTENYRILDRASWNNALLQAYNPHRSVYQYDTEWGMICDKPDGREDGRCANIVGTLHRAVRLIYYAREDLLKGASGWNLLTRPDAPGFGILSQEASDKRYLLYWLYYYFNRHLGEWVLPMDGIAPYYQPQQEADRVKFSGPLTPVLATLSRDSKEIYLVIANGSWSQSFPCSVATKGFNARSSSGVLLSNGDADGNPLLQCKEDAISDFPVTVNGTQMTCKVPPHSVVFITLRKTEPKKSEQ